jgi:hypothetical protein
MGTLGIPTPFKIKYAVPFSVMASACQLARNSTDCPALGCFQIHFNTKIEKTSSKIAAGIQRI